MVRGWETLWVTGLRGVLAGAVCALPCRSAWGQLRGVRRELRVPTLPRLCGFRVPVAGLAGALREAGRRLPFLSWRERSPGLEPWPPAWRCWRRPQPWGSDPDLFCC